MYAAAVTTNNFWSSRYCSVCSIMGWMICSMWWMVCSTLCITTQLSSTIPCSTQTARWLGVKLKDGGAEDRSPCHEAPRLLPPPSVAEAGTSVLLLPMYARPSSGQRSAACMSKESTSVTSIRSCGAIVLRNIKTTKTMGSSGYNGEREKTLHMSVKEQKRWECKL